MKKINIMIFCAVLSFAVMACGNNQNAVYDNESNEIEAEHNFVSEEETIKENDDQSVEEDNELTEEENVATEEESVVTEEESVVTEEVNIQGQLIIRGATFYPPLTRKQAEANGIEYDGLTEVNGVEFVTYDWVIGDDLMEEEFSDSEMTVETYAEAMGGHIASEEELSCLMSREPVIDPEYGFGWPTVYWISDWWSDEEEGESNPLLYDLEEYWDGSPLGYDFPQFNLPVIVVIGEMYDPDYSGGMEMREKEIAEDGTGYFVNMLWNHDKEVEEIVTIYVNESTKIYDENGNLVGPEALGPSQLEMEIVMDDTNEFAVEIYILPFSM